MQHLENLQTIKEFITTGIIAMFGGIANYIYTTFKTGKPCKIYGFSVNATLAFFLGNVIGNFIPENFEYRDGCLLLTGFSTFPLLELFEVYTTLFVKKLLDKNLSNIK